MIIDDVLHMHAKRRVQCQFLDFAFQKAHLGAVKSTENHWESLLRCTQQKDHSILNNGKTCDAAFRQNALSKFYDYMHARNFWPIRLYFMNKLQIRSVERDK